MKNKRTIFLLGIFLCLSIFFRLYNLDQTARFTRDEANDLFRMQQIYEDKKITLVGPISNDNGKVFGSLTYYMYLPFAILGNFDPISPAWGAAFWGVASSIILLALAKKFTKNKISFLLATLLAIIWLPLLRTSRWAWNPHLVIFWVTLGIYLNLYKNKFAKFAAGLCLGLSFHHHYVTIFATAPFVIIIAILEVIKNRSKKNLYGNWQEALALLFGFGFAFLPFALFDLRHPPGLFFGKYLLSSDKPHGTKLTILIAVQNLLRNTQVFLDSIIQNKFLQKVFFLGSLGLIYKDWQKNKKSLIWLIPIVTVIIAGIIIDFYFVRYVLAALPFLFVWLLLKRKDSGQKLANFLLAILVLGSLFGLRYQLYHVEVQAPIKTVREITRYMKGKQDSGVLKNPNIAILKSHDKSPLGDKYRELFKVYGIDLRAASEYDVSEQLFVFSQESDISALRQDKSTAMAYFKEAKLADTYKVPNSDWYIYWLRF